MASVDDVCFEWQPYTGEFKDFQGKKYCLIDASFLRKTQPTFF